VLLNAQHQLVISCNAKKPVRLDAILDQILNIMKIKQKSIIMEVSAGQKVKKIDKPYKIKWLANRKTFTIIQFKLSKRQC
jgi:hypothetical protein